MMYNRDSIEKLTMANLNNTNIKKRKWDDFSPCQICLINPPWITRNDNIWHGIKAAMPPLGLLTIAAALEEKGKNIAIIDAHVEKLSISELKERIYKLQPKIVGITVMTATAIQANLIARTVKQIDQSITVVMGGVHAEVLPEECLNNRCVDIVVRGDGEVTFNDLCDAVLSGKSYKHIKGISFRAEEMGETCVINNPSADVITDLNRLPMPNYNLVPMHRYYPAIGAYRRLPAINMLITRGCPGKCSFCNSAKTTLRTRDAELVVKEILILKEQYGIKEIQFYDDTFTIYKANVLKFCKLMKENKVDVSWTAFARVDCIDECMAREMKEAGCHQIMFGVESGDTEVLKKMGKPIQLEQTKKAIKIAKDAGIEVRCTFIYGCEGETIGSMQKTLDFAFKLDADIALFNIATPYPGTQLFRWAKEKGFLITEEWAEYELGHPVLKLPTVSPRQIQDFYNRSFKMLYRQPKMILRRLKKATSFYHWRDMIKAFFFIMFRHQLGVGGSAQTEWISWNKADFFDYSFHKNRSTEKTPNRV